jgi:hypothetical protein
METLALDGFWLLGGLGVAFLLGVFLSAKVKDLVYGVPSELRAALNVAQKDALSTLKTAKANTVADVANLFTKTTVTKSATPAAVHESAITSSTVVASVGS